MFKDATIAWGMVPYNQADHFRRKNRRRATVKLLLTTIISACIVMAGCASSKSGRLKTEVPLWQLATAEPTPIVWIGRARLSPKASLPGHLIQNLSDEFDLVTIHGDADWQNFQKIVCPTSYPPVVDLRRGMILGVVARVGEPARSEWPIQFQAVRECCGAGLIEINFAPGLYHPVQTSSFVELVYIPVTCHIRTVRINRRTFIMQPLEEDPNGLNPVQEQNRTPNPKPQC